MAIRRMVLADEDTTKKRVEQLDEQIKQAQETLKQAKESDPKSERVFNLNTRINNLKSQRDRLKHRADEQKENEEKDKEESSLETDRESLKRTVFTAINDLTTNGKKSQRYKDLTNKYRDIYSKISRAFDKEALQKLARAFEALRVAQKQMANATCEKHGKTDCQSTLCPESPNFNVLTTI